MSTEVLDAQDVVNMDVEQLKRTSAEFEVDVQSLVDAFPAFEHHMTVKAKLRELARKGVISTSEMEEVNDRWQAK